MMRLQFDEAVDRLTGQWDDGDRLPRDEVQFTIGFVDLAESTRLTISAEPTAFAAAVRDFEGLGRRSRGAEHGARLVKLIGDSAMIAGPFAARSPTRAAISSRRCPATTASGARTAASRRAASSPRNGDYFGPPGNLASRLSGVSEPGEILCDAMTAADCRQPGSSRPAPACSAASTARNPSTR